MESSANGFTSGLSEIVLIVEDVLAAARFYREVVGLVPRSEATEEWAWFWAGASDQPQSVALHRGKLLFEEHSAHPEGQRFGHVHYAFRVERDRLDGAVAHIRSCGVEVYGPTDFDWMSARSYYFYDPDGNLLEYWSPSPDAR